MNGTILDVLQVYGLDDLNTLSQRLNNFSDEDWNNFADALEAFFDSQSDPEPTTELVSPLTFTFPFLNPIILNDTVPYLIMSDKVYIDDPLSTLVYALPMIRSIPTDGYLHTSHFILPKSIKGEAVLSEWFDEVTVQLVDRIKEVITFYLKARELIREGKLIPFAPPGFSSDVDIQVYHEVNKFLSDGRFRRVMKVPTKLWAMSIGRIRFNYYHFVCRKELLDSLKTALPFMQRFLDNSVFNTFSFYSIILNLKSPGKYGYSMDLLTPENFYIFRSVLELLRQCNLIASENQQILTPSHISPLNVNLPMLSHIPVERVLDIIDSEPDAFENFRGYCNEKLLEIDAPPGDPDRDRQILAINQAIKKETKSLDMVYKEIQQSFNRNFSTNIALASASILVAGLSTMGSNLDLISTIGKVVAGGGMAASISGFAKEWLDYQREVQKLKLNENYFIWKLTSKK